MATAQVATFLVLLQVIIPFSGANLAVKMPTECVGKQYCPIPGDTYPTDMLEKLLAEPLVEMVDKLIKENEIFGNRLGDDALIKCEYESKKAPVFYIVDKNNKTRVVIQKKGVFEQKFDLYTCTKPYPATQGFGSGVINDQNIQALDIRCVQEYANYDIYVMSEDYKSVEKVKMAQGLPVYCACRYYKSNYKL